MKMSPTLPSFLDPERLDRLIESALDEDVGSGDVTSESTIDERTTAEGTFLAKASGTLAGLAVAEKVFHRIDPSLEVDWEVADGAAVRGGTAFGRVRGSARAMLSAERLALNFLQRMSGIATQARRLVTAVEGTGARVLDTRKTAPGLRALDKWAVLLGGASNHRAGLFDMILIKDNHISAAGGVKAALEAVRSRKGVVPIEIETRTLAEVRDVISVGVADRILLDNMARRDANGRLDTSMLEEAVSIIAGRVETEASGNVTMETIKEIAETGVDFVSCGALTHSVQALDISLLIDLEPIA